MAKSHSKPHVVVLGGNFAGLGSAQKIREYAGDSVDITVIDKKSSLLFVPNIPAEVFTNHDPALSMFMDIIKPLEKDGIRFLQAEVNAIDPDARRVDYVPAERPGAATNSITFDYLVIALGSRLAYDRIEGFAEYGDTLSDTYHGNKLRHYLNDGYKGGPIAIGSARFHQGDGANGLEPYPGGSIPIAEAACEGPPVETMLAAATWLQQQKKGGPKTITVFTPAKVIAEDAGETVVNQLLEIASGMGFGYKNETRDITRLTADGIEFASGDSLEAEIKIIFPDWVAHDFLRDLPISDSMGFIRTNLHMRNPDYPHIFAAGDAAAVTVPKLGAIGHQQCEIIGRQIGNEMNRVSDKLAEEYLQPVVLCIGDMGANQAFYIRSNTWYGGNDAVLKMGRVPYMLKMQYKTLFFNRHGKVPNWGIDFAEVMTEKLFG
ncbi:MAG: pyridine nucleotide-disulfide oxidoreductase [Gammaproteobacteria bacterium]|nr:pyridine nucleotide-disulfide oxidoreductase [Gammaproteobacteria bacterium]